MPVLIAISPKLAVKEYEVNGPLSIGRHESNAIQLSEERASRQHCRIVLERGQGVIEDLDSANGTFVNGLRVNRQALKHNDRITIGKTTLIYCEDDSSEKLDETQVLMEGISSQVEAIIVDRALKEVRAKARARRPRRQDHHHGSAVLLCFLAVCAGGYFYWRTQQQVQNTGNATAAAKTRTSVTTDRAASSLVTTPSNDSATEPPKGGTANKLVISVEDQFKKALATKERAMASGNLLGAKSALQSFLSALPADQAESDFAKRARSTLEDTTKISNAAFELALNQARSALEAKRFQAVFQRCTNLISNDPAGPYGAKARDILEQIDERTATVAEGAKAKALDAIGRGQLDEARTVLEGVLGELSGTRWSGDVSTLHLQTLVAGGLLDEIEAARAKKAAAGEDVRIVFAQKKIEGTLARVKGLMASVQIGAGAGSTQGGVIDLSVNLKAIEPKDFIATLDTLELSNRHAELGCLWQLLGRKDAAKAASEAALKNPGKTPPAVVMAGLLSDSKNLHFYDFSDWRQQTHWEAVSGSWLTQDGKYVLESADGGETFLKPESIGGLFPLDKARLGFDLELSQLGEGWFLTCEFGGDQQSAIVSFEAGADGKTEVSLQDKTGAKSAGAKVPASKDGAMHVDLAIDGENATLRLNGVAACTLASTGLSQQKGKLAIQAHQCACAIDNVVLRTQE
ncbi:MAG TPA: FHA domain-containing protein [Planctomycetota bacterium]|nr:FHA domain-containing protein [Planctomycetota bacterium]